MEEKGLHIKVSAELFKKIKIKLAEDGITLKDYLIKLIEEDLEKNK